MSSTHQTTGNIAFSSAETYSSTQHDNHRLRFDLEQIVLPRIVTSSSAVQIPYFVVLPLSLAEACAKPPGMAHGASVLPRPDAPLLSRVQG
jgi:hypothetical protein